MTNMSERSSLSHDGVGLRHGDVARELLDSPRELAFDRATRVSAAFIGTPLSLVSVVSNGRHYVKSAFGLPEELADTKEVPYEHSYCRHVQDSGDMLSIADTEGHPLVGGNPLNAMLGIRSYLGLPVRSGEDTVACTLCVIDSEPREWTSEEVGALRDLADMLETELVLRGEIAVREAVEQRNRLLLREMEHRVKNSLSTVQAIVSLSLRTERDIEKLRRTLSERIAAMAKTHALVLEGERRGALLQTVFASELDPYDIGGRIALDIGRIELSAPDAVVIGLVVHELTTNAAKYGALADGGRLRVACTLDEDGREDRRLRIDWRESGVPLKGPPEGEGGFGTTLLQTLILRQYRGRIERDWTPDGLALTIEMSVSDVG